MKGYGGRGLDGTDKVELVRDRQALRHAMDRLEASTSQSGLKVLFIDLEGVQVPYKSKDIEEEVWEMMHRTKAAEPGGTTGSLMQIATVSGEVVLIDLFAFRLYPDGTERGSVGVFAKGGEVKEGDKAARGGARLGGRALGLVHPDAGPGAGFELPDDLARVLSNHLLVCFAGINDHQMLTRLYGIKQWCAKRASSWTWCDLQIWFNHNPCSGGRSDLANDDAVGLGSAWVDCCADDRARSHKDLAAQMLTAGSGYLKGFAYASVPR
ncbi:MAG: hypothetical protein GY737_10675, partial [Desulfobacteraceae bacterium]|nr:hypothetical protein [Desulfobacteraceae bacterium]